MPAVQAAVTLGRQGVEATQSRQPVAAPRMPEASLAVALVHLPQAPIAKTERLAFVTQEVSHSYLAVTPRAEVAAAGTSVGVPLATTVEVEEAQASWAAPPTSTEKLRRVTGGMLGRQRGQRRAGSTQVKGRYQVDPQQSQSTLAETVA